MSTYDDLFKKTLDAVEHSGDAYDPDLALACARIYATLTVAQAIREIGHKPDDNEPWMNREAS